MTTQEPKPINDGGGAPTPATDGGSGSTEVDYGVPALPNFANFDAENAPFPVRIKMIDWKELERRIAPGEVVAIQVDDGDVEFAMTVIQESVGFAVSGWHANGLLWLFSESEKP